MLLQEASCNDILCGSIYCSFVAQTSGDQTILMGWCISETHRKYKHAHTSDKYWPHFWVDSVAVQQFNLLHVLCLNASALRNLKVFVRCCTYSKSVPKVIVINYFGIYFRLFLLLLLLKKHILGYRMGSLILLAGSFPNKLDVSIEGTWE